MGTRHVLLNNNPFHCDCDSLTYLRLYFDDIRYRNLTKIFIEADNLLCQSPERWKNVTVSSISPRDDICLYDDKACPDKAICHRHPLTKSITLDFHGQGLREAPNISDFEKRATEFDEIFVNLSGNYIRKFPEDWNEIGYGKVYELDLSNNTIEDIESIPEHLRILHLHNNNLTHLSNKTLSLFKEIDLHNLTLHNNSWTCNCSTVNFHKYIQENFDKVIIIAYLLILIRL